MRLQTRVVLGIALVLLVSGAANAQLIGLQAPTATFSQGFGGGIAATIDGNLGTANGWAIDDGVAPTTQAQIGVWETVTNVSPAVFRVTLHNLDSGNAQHTVGRFRISATSDDRSTFADGLATGGDVTANWTVLTPIAVSATNLTTLTIQGDGSILASGTNPSTSTYTIDLVGSINNVTGFRLEVLEAVGLLPTDGPGRAFNGNFVLTEFQVTATPEPTSIALWCGLGIAGLVCVARRRK